jgi:hypothetical protein
MIVMLILFIIRLQSKGLEIQEMWMKKIDIFNKPLVFQNSNELSFWKCFEVLHSLLVCTSIGHSRLANF